MAAGSLPRVATQHLPPAMSVAERLAALGQRLSAAHLDSGDTAQPSWQAATALVLAPGPDDVEVAIIERTQRVGDRWSGQLALPGGRREPDDPDLAVTAARETREEVGLELPGPIAELARHRARVRPGVVACYAFTLPHPVTMTPAAREVAAAWWVPLGALADPANRTTVRHRGVRFPAIDVHGRALWGLTLGLLERFGEVVGLPLATR